MEEKQELVNEKERVKNRKLTTKEKVAVFLLTMGTERASAVLSCLEKEQAHEIVLEIGKLKSVSPEERVDTVKEFHNLIMASKAITQGGIGTARNILEKLYSPQEADMMLRKLKNELEDNLLSIARRSEPIELLNAIQNEHPQIIALVLSSIEPDNAAIIIEQLPKELYLDVSKRIGEMGKISNEYLIEVDSLLKLKLGSSLKNNTEVGGDKVLADIVNRVSRNTEKSILGFLNDIDGELAENVRQHLFVFDDIATCLSTKDIRIVVTKLKTREIAMALKAADDNVKIAILNSISERQREMIEEEIESLPPQRKQEIEKVQKYIVSIIRELEEKEEITISRAGEELV